MKNYAKGRSMSDQELLTKGIYQEFITELKSKIRTAQINTAFTVNSKLIHLYWDLGKAILSKQKEAKWGDKIIENIAKDLSAAFPDAKGFSITNLKYMKRFAEEYQELKIGQQAADQLPWGHNIVLMTRVRDMAERAWYAREAVQNGWSRNVLELQIKSKLSNRQGKALTNFKEKLPLLQSELAHQTLKDPYIFDFLSISREAHERDVEKELVKHITKFLLELGTGFSFVGQQYHLPVKEEDYYLDLLFYHLKLRCYVVVELKTGKFKPEYAGKINFYLSAVDDLVRDSSDNPSIGIILCRDKNEAIAEYALRDVNKPIGVSEYQILESIPEKLQISLPTVDELEEELMNFQEVEGFPYNEYLVMVNKWVKENMLECWIAPIVLGQSSAGDRIAIIQINDFESEKQAIEFLKQKAKQEIDQRK